MRFRADAYRPHITSPDSPANRHGYPPNPGVHIPDPAMPNLAEISERFPARGIAVSDCRSAQPGTSRRLPSQ